jgi:hypothetical protein
MEAPPHSSIADKAAVIRSRVARELRYPPRVAEATQTNLRLLMPVQTTVKPVLSQLFWTVIPVRRKIQGACEGLPDGPSSPREPIHVLRFPQGHPQLDHARRNRTFKIESREHGCRLLQIQTAPR